MNKLCQKRTNHKLQNKIMNQLVLRKSCKIVHILPSSPCSTCSAQLGFVLNKRNIIIKQNKIDFKC